MAVEKQNWSLVIKPSRRFLDIPFREIWEYRDLLFLLVRRDFVSLYKQTILGPLWFIIQPVLTTVVFTLVFGNIAKIIILPLLMTSIIVLSVAIYQTYNIEINALHLILIAVLSLLYYLLLTYLAERTLNYGIYGLIKQILA